MNFLSRSAFFISFFIYFGIISNSLLGQDCPKPKNNNLLKATELGFVTSGDKIELGKKFEVKANPNLISSVRNSIRYHVGYLANPTEFDAISIFKCPCKTSSNVIIANLTSFETLQIPDFDVIFNVAGYYYIIQTYVDASGIGRYECLRVTVYPRSIYSYRLCGCNDVLVTIPKIDENLFYDEVAVSLSGTTTIIKRAQFGSEIKLPSLTPDPNCSARSSLNATARVLQPFYSEYGIESISRLSTVDPIDFTINKNGNSNPNIYIKELKQEANDDFNIIFSSNTIDGLEVSYDAGTNWLQLPVTDYLVIVSGKEFLIKGLVMPKDSDVCFRGFSNCGSIKTPEADRPTICFTGQIEKITDKFSDISGKRDVIVTLKTKLSSVPSLVIRDYDSTNQYKITSSTKEYTDAQATCGDLMYRTETIVLNIYGFTKIISKPVSYKISENNIQSFEGVSVVSIKSSGYSSNNQIADLSVAPKVNLGKSFNFYKSLNGSAFTKLNTTPVNQLFFQDFSTDPTVVNCYYAKAQDQCGFETPASKTICTTLLKSNGNLIEWTKKPVALSESNEYEEIEGYLPQLVTCVNGVCDKYEDIPIVKNENSFNMDIVDKDPTTIHFVNVRVQVQFEKNSKARNVYSNIIEHYFQPKLFIPNIITPNNDKSNDELKIEGFHIKNLVLDIYSRWGEKIETLTNINQKWIPNVNLPEGEYFYKASATDYSPNSNKITKQGSILLVR